MIQRAFLCAGLGLALASLHGVAFAHDDDPKLLDKQPIYRGQGFRAARLATPAAGSWSGGSTVVMSPIPFTASDVQLRSWLPISEFGSQHVSGNDCWGYVAPSGREYALMGLSNGTGFVEVSDPDAASIVAVLPGPSSLWRDMKVYQQHAYAVSEGGDGIQVFDLTQIDAGLVSQVNTITFGGNTTASHNVAIDELSGFLYRAGGGDHGLRIYSLANPAAPSFVASYDDRYVHDVQVKTYTSGPYAGRQIAFCAGGLNGGFVDMAIDVVDVTNKGSLFLRDRFHYPNPAYSHQCWLSEDASRLYVNDELDEDGVLPTTTYTIDTTDLDNLSLAGSFTNGNQAIGHNVYTHDGLLFEANYRSGLRVFDITANPNTPSESAWFDTYPSDDSANFNGLWSVFPYFPSGTVIGSDLEKGLFVWRVGSPTLTLAEVSAPPTVLSPFGDSFVVSLTPTGSTLVPGSAQLHLLGPGGWTSTPLTALGGDQWRADLAPLPCGSLASFYVSADSADGMTWTLPQAAGGATYTAPVGSSLLTVTSYTMESTQGWSSGVAGDDATTGLWTRDDPLGTAAQPEDDHTSGGGNTDCWFTGQGPLFGGVGDNDVDGGTTTLLSPVIDMSGLTEPRLSWWCWYVNSAAQNPPDDSFVVEISNNGGSSWTNLQTLDNQVMDVEGAWFQYQVRVADVIAPTASMRLRFRASDLGNGSIVEAAIDDFAVLDVTCDGACQPDLGFGGPGALSLSICGGALETGSSADVSVSGALPFTTVFLPLALSSTPVPFKGGTLVPVPFFTLLALPGDSNGELNFPVPGGGGPFSVFVQAISANAGLPGGFAISNAVEALFEP